MYKIIYGIRFFVNLKPGKADGRQKVLQFGCCILDLQCIGTMPYVHKLCETWLPVAGVPFPHAFPHFKAHFPFPLTYIHYSGDFQVFLINEWALYFENITIVEQKAATVSKAGTGRYDIPEFIQPKGDNYYVTTGN